MLTLQSSCLCRAAPVPPLLPCWRQSLQGCSSSQAGCAAAAPLVTAVLPVSAQRHMCQSCALLCCRVTAVNQKLLPAAADLGCQFRNLARCREGLQYMDCCLCQIAMSRQQQKGRVATEPSDMTDHLVSLCNYCVKCMCAPPNTCQCAVQYISVMSIAVKSAKGKQDPTSAARDPTCKRPA